MATEKKLFEGKTLAILTGGGDTPAINSSVELMRNRALILGYKVYGIRKGWKGLLGDGDIVNLTNMPYNGWYGGTALGSSRTNPFPTKKSPENRVPQILKNLEKYKIDVLVTVGGDDTNGAAKKLYETEGIPVIGFPKTIDNDLRTKTIHKYEGRNIEAVLCPGFPTAAESIMEMTARLRSTAESHSRIIVLEVMGRDAGWLTGSAIFGGADLSLIPEFEITKERKAAFFETVKEVYLNHPKKNLIIAVSEGTRWYDEAKDKVDVIYASSELDEYGHPRFGGISGIISSEISKNLKIDARSQISGYYPRSGDCGWYDRQLNAALADKAADLLLRKDYGRMPVIKEITGYCGLEEFNTSTIDMGHTGNRPLPEDYYDIKSFQFTDAYFDFLSNILGESVCPQFETEFPPVKP